MRIGCIFFPSFAAQVESKDNNALKGKPVIIGGFPYELKPVYDVSEEAMRHGVKPGISLRQAYVLCPQGIFLPLAEGKYHESLTSIVSLLANYSPVIELGAKNCVFLDSTLESDEMGFMKEIMEIIREETSFYTCSGIASNKFVAWVASQVISGPDELIVVHDSEDRGLLKALPVDLLPASPESLRMLKLCGIYKMGELAQLPCEAVKSQFGKEGQTLWQLANGIDDSRLVPGKMPEMLIGELSFEPLAENLSLILNRADELLSKLSQQLKQRWQCCHQLTVTLSLANDHIAQRTFHFKEPTSSKEAMLGQLKYCLEKARFDAPIKEMRLSLSDLSSEEGKQASFLDKPLRSRQRLISAISQLQHRYGQEVVKKIVPRDKAALPENSFSFTKFGL